MNSKTQKVALVTGANSGIGLETVKQLSKQFYDKIILACRTLEKGEITRLQLIKEGFKDVYTPLAIDVAEAQPAYKAVEVLQKAGEQIDLLVLNACVSPGKLTKNTKGMELTFASALFGHHILAKGLLDANLLSENARIVTAGSEAARGDVPGMGLPDIDSLVKHNYKGDTEGALKSFLFPAPSHQYTSMKTYAMVKLYVSLWTSALARKLPNGMVANSISPGSTPNTNFIRHQSFAMKHIMIPLMKTIGPYIGMAGSIEDAALRYLKVVDMNAETNGKFWASKKGKMTGSLAIFSSKYIDNKSYQDSIWDIIDGLAIKSKANKEIESN